MCSAEPQWEILKRLEGLEPRCVDPKSVDQTLGSSTNYISRDCPGKGRPCDYQLGKTKNESGCLRARSENNRENGKKSA